MRQFYVRHAGTESGTDHWKVCSFVEHGVVPCFGNERYPFRGAPTGVRHEA